MRIGIISDLHLGFRQYGSIEREQDFYRQFHTVCLALKEESPDIVIIAGDLFNTPTPSPAAIHAYREGIKVLNTPVFTIKGNHTMVMRDNHYSIDEFFGSTNELKDYHLLDDVKFEQEGLEVSIDGITYRNNSSMDEFKSVQKFLAETKSIWGSYRILVVHQAFSEFCGFIGEELSITDIDYKPYDLVICGHIHSRTDTQINKKTLFVQPGSIERMNTTEAKDEEKNGKGFYIVETEDNTCEFHQVECPRKFFLDDIEIGGDFSILDFYEKLEKAAGKMKLAPIISYNFHNYSGDVAAIRENIISTRKNILIDNSNIYDETQNEDVSVEIGDLEVPTILSLLKKRTEEEFGEKDASFSVDLYNLLKDDSDGIDVFLDEFFDERSKTEDEINIEEDLEEINELERFFDNLGGA